jgi:hypothetical protein
MNIVLQLQTPGRIVGSSNDSDACAQAKVKAQLHGKVEL